MADDRDAIRLMAGENATGLERLYDRYATMVYSLALRVVGETAEAEDVTQDVFAKLWTNAGRLDGAPGSVAAWLTMTARSRSLDSLRRRRVRGGEAADPDAEIPDLGPSVEVMAASAEQVEAARLALAALPDEQRIALELACYEGFTQTEIAERTRTPLGVVKTRIRAGLQQIREAMQRHAASPGRQG